MNLYLSAVSTYQSNNNIALNYRALMEWIEFDSSWTLNYRAYKCKSRSAFSETLLQAASHVLKQQKIL